ncbi:BLUF domain-containing protein [Novosphingobium pokkalii]|uniref:BLUF domain-containing protein n=1 Tax=Novosphingobium pokkalii TaxID=1770194 RepID=A0ABV7V4N2_9SPHN|nr:BLUF domain-containing protein [Novosphingobium pokkalii]GHC82993.1 hypothetical protein GCM10019060_02110 [Novosphingobium pokkalii]
MRPDEDLRLHHWLYISRCVVEPAWTAAMMDTLVAHAKGRNASIGLTGALLFTGTHFLQALEGPPTALALMRAAIGEDRRHTALVTLDEGSIPERRFAGWSLAYAGGSIYLANKVRGAMDGGAPALMHLLETFVGSAGLQA